MVESRTAESRFTQEHCNPPERRKGEMDPKVEAQKIAQMYKENPCSRKLHGIVVGEKGAGKTSLIETCPKPVLVHSFDPGGTSVLDPDLIDGGDILVDTRFEHDTEDSPRAYRTWEDEFNRLGREGFFNHIGTYVIDSITTFCDTLIWQILAKEGRKRASMRSKSDRTTQGMQIPDWGTLLNTMIMLTRSLGNLPCHTLLMGHIDRDRDETIGKVVYGLMLPGKSSEKVPINMHEYYVLRSSETPRGIERHLLTQNDGDYRATTRMGRKGLFNKQEEPNIQALLKKADYDWEDKPSLLKGGPTDAKDQSTP